jgi:uncharacterized membrane protein YkoI
MCVGARREHPIAGVDSGARRMGPMLNTHRSLAVIVASLGLLVAAPLPAEAGDSHSCQAKVSLENARATALKEVPGTVLHEELEDEHGRCIYEFKIRPSAASDQRIREVSIDANTGSVVEVEVKA